MKKADLTVGEERWVTIGDFILVRVVDVSVPGAYVVVEPVERRFAIPTQRVGLTPAQVEERRVEIEAMEAAWQARRAARQ